MVHLSTQPISALLLMILAGLFIAKVVERTPIPDVVAFLVTGMILGPGVHLLASRPMAAANQFVVVMGAIFILFEGGRSLRIHVFEKIWRTVILLATIGVIISVVVMTLAAHFLSGLPWAIALLLASVIANTDPAALIPIFERIGIEPLVAQTAEAEAAFNDAMATVLTTMFIGLALGNGTLSFSSSVFVFLRIVVTSLGIGMVMGYLTLQTLSTKGFGVLKEFASMAGLLNALAAYQMAIWLGASGYMAVFVAGMVMGNGGHFSLPLHKETYAHLLHFNQIGSFLFRLLIFILLGSQVRFALLQKYGMQAFVLVVILLFVARPLSVTVAMKLDRRLKWRWRSIWFMWWVRETGVISVALATLVVQRKVPHANFLLTVVFVTVLLTLLVQAPTTEWLAKKLGLLRPKPLKEL